MKKSLFLANLQALLAEAWARRDAARTENERDMWSAVASHLEYAWERARR